MAQLSVVVTCTDRKRLPAPAVLQARTLPEQRSNAARSSEWKRRLRVHRDPSAPLVALYKGEAWTQARKVMQISARHHRAQALVASAGLGLQDPESSHPPYAATFSPGHADTVATATDGGTQQWWGSLRQVDGALTLTELPSWPIIVVLSEAYARAMDEDLRLLGQERAGEILMVGGWRDVAGVSRLPADLALRSALGGTAGSLLLRMAAQWLELNPEDPVTVPSDNKAWNEWATAHRKVERYDRTALTDPEVQQFIANALQRQPSLSATQALRELRTNGFACEQKRFGNLFARTKDTAA